MRSLAPRATISSVAATLLIIGDYGGSALTPTGEPSGPVLAALTGW